MGVFFRNILVDKPNDQSSRWSSESNYPPQVFPLLFTHTFTVPGEAWHEDWQFALRTLWSSGFVCLYCRSVTYCIITILLVTATAYIFLGETKFASVDLRCCFVCFVSFMAIKSNKSNQTNQKNECREVERESVTITV